MASTALSKGFFYFLAMDQMPQGFQPVIQLIQVRRLDNNGSPNFRVRSFDGVFVYSRVFILPQREDDLMIGQSVNIIVKVRNFQTAGQGEKLFMTIMNYEIIGHGPMPMNPITFGNNADHYTDFVRSNGYSLEETKPSSSAAAAPDKISPLKRPTTFAAANNDLKRMRMHQGSPKRQLQLPSTKSLASKTTPSRPVAEPGVSPLKLITPFVTMWRICGIVSQKSPMRETQKGNHVMSFNLTDEAGDTIKLTAWGVEADAMNVSIHDGLCYYISGQQGSIRKKNGRFNLTDLDFEITLNSSSVVVPCTDRNISLPRFSIKRTLINDVKDAKGHVDVLAVVDKVSPTTNVFSKAKNKDLVKQEVTLVDESLATISLTLWEEKVESFNDEVGKAVALKNASIHSFNGGFSLGIVQATEVVADPEFSDTLRLYKWYRSERASATLNQMSSSGSNINIAEELRTLSSINDGGLLDSHADGILFSARVLITDVRRDNPYYTACGKCNKKVTSVDNGYHCEKCKTTLSTYTLRYMLSVSLSDITGSIYVTMFDDQAAQLLGMSADHLEHLQKTDRDAFNATFEPIMFHSYIARLRATLDYYNDQKRVKYGLLNIRSIPIIPFDRALDSALEVLENL